MNEHLGKTAEQTRRTFSTLRTLTEQL